MATAAVRTFPFRVFSFPKEIKRATVDVGYYADYGFESPVGVAVWRAPIGGTFILIEEISLAEARARYGYEWRPAHPKTQQAKSNPRLYCAPLGTSTTGIIQ